MKPETVEVFKKKVQHYEESLRKVLVNLKITPKNRISQSYLNTKRMLAETVWSHYDTTYSEAFISCESDELAVIPSFASEAHDRAEETFVEIMEWIDSRYVQIHSNTQNDQSNSNPQSATAEKEVLKSLSLPKFNGEFSSWLTFHDMFVSLVHDNKRLSKVQKLQYLKAATAGEAEGLLAPYAVTEANYDDAWKLMLRVYNNTRLIVDGQLDVLFSLKPVLVESATELKHLIYSTDQVLKSLKNSGIVIENWDYFIIHMSARKLPSATRSLWEQEISGKTELPKFEEFLTFVEKRYRSLMVSGSIAVKAESSGSNQKKGGSKPGATGCTACHSDHEVERCPQFVSMSVTDRWKFVKRSLVCFQCLKPGHKITSCKVGTKCMYCTKVHHTLLHDSSKAGSSKDESSKSSKEAFHTTAKSEKEKVFATVLVNAKASDGEVHTLRGVLDPTSNSCFVTARACRLLKGRVVPDETMLTGLGGKPLGLSSSSTVFGISSIYNSSKICDVTALVVQSVSSKQPSKKLEGRECWENLKELQLADPMFNVPGDIDLLLDVEVFSLIVRSGLIKMTGGPNAHETSLGWIVLGVVNPTHGIKPLNSKRTEVFLTDVTLSDQLRRFWEQEERGSEEVLSAEDVLCEKLFTESTFRKEDGRFVVQLPMKERFGETCKLGESRKVAYSRFNSLESRLKRDSVLCQKYKECIGEYFELNQIDKCGPATDQSYYIPHHAVNKAGKFRVVFDASCKTSSGASLNDCMYAGPKLQKDLWVVINNWRKYQYVFQSDIEKMYRQVEVFKEDANRQRVLWRPKDDAAIGEFQLTGLTFGVKAAPFLAMRTLQLLADEEKDRFPRAQYAIKHEMYVDDLRSGDDSVEGAVELRNQINGALEAGKFPLRKWIANDSRLLEGLPLEHLDERGLFEISDRNSGAAVQSLGLLWDPKKDVFQFRIKEHGPPVKWSKRILLSRIAGLYDPMGWISPVIAKPKILMQSLWGSNCDWDELVSSDVTQKWLAIESSLFRLREVAIPRWVKLTKSITSYQVHSFCDASLKAFSAVTYLRIVDESNNVVISLLSSKSRVAPLKTITLPRLELCGSVLASELNSSVVKSLGLSPERICFWCDSEIVLAWLRQSPQRWTTFVANRVASVQSMTRESTWSYVPSKENPADCASRGVSPQELVEHQLWWTGPSWLSKPETSWPRSNSEFQTDLELKAKAVLFTARAEFSEFVENYSSLRKASRVLARMLLWKVPSDFRESRLSSSDLKYSVVALVRLTQSKHFEKEISLLIKGKELRSESETCRSLAKLNPFVDAHGVLRVGGRIRYCRLSFNRRHPMILPRDSYLARLIIRDYHELTLHGSVQEVLNYVRQSFWLMGGRNAVQSALTSCVNCNRIKARLCSQIMADLPTSRISSEGQSFVHCGLDYAGPVYCRASTLRNAIRIKCYIALFICFSSKAVNLQLVTDKSVNAFMKAFARFTSLRGKPSVMYSDNEKAFVGADRLIQRESREVFRRIHEEARDLLANEGITWLFNPPEAPHHGGLWESNVKSMKRHLFASIGNALLTYEELSTVLARIEACLNSRPLCAMTEDPEDFDVLTPGHFLIGRPLLSVPESNCLDLDDHVLSRWRYLQKLSQTFWKRWSDEYLGTLQNRNKWMYKSRQLQVGDLVLLKEDLIHPLKWRRGRIIEVMLGKDGSVRVIKIKTMSGVLIRDVRQICLLSSSLE